jgi:hypothetical protein
MPSKFFQETILFSSIAEPLLLHLGKKPAGSEQVFLEVP